LDPAERSKLAAIVNVSVLFTDVIGVLWLIVFMLNAGTTTKRGFMPCGMPNESGWLLATSTAESDPRMLPAPSSIVADMFTGGDVCAAAGLVNEKNAIGKTDDDFGMPGDVTVITMEPLFFQAPDAASGAPVGACTVCALSSTVKEPVRPDTVTLDPLGRSQVARKRTMIPLRWPDAGFVCLTSV